MLAHARFSGGSNNVLRCCFHDGREIEGYVGTLVGAVRTQQLLIENCVFINGMGEAISAGNSPDLTVRHCVFYNNFIRAMTAHMERADILVHLDHNLICDSIPQKVNNALLRIRHVDALRAGVRSLEDGIARLEARLAALEARDTPPA